MDKIGILGIVGSLRKDSYNWFALKAAQEIVPDGAVLDLIDLHGIPVSIRMMKWRRPRASLNSSDGFGLPMPSCLPRPSTTIGSRRAQECYRLASRPYGESAWQRKPAAIMGASVGSLGTAARNITCGRCWLR